MKRSKKKSRQRVIRLWSYPEAVRAVPYLHSVTQSIRDHYVEAVQTNREINVLGNKKLDRDTRIALQVKGTEKSEAETKFNEALRELRKIDAFLLDPVNGVVLIPTQRKEELAWIVYDLFDENGLVGWRFHHEALEARHPLQELEDGSAGVPPVATSA